MRTKIAALLAAACLAGPAGADEIGPLVKQVQAVGREGTGNAAAAAAWRQLSRQGPQAVLPILNALDSASPAAGNWLRSALDAIVEQERAANRPMPIKDLEAFLADTKHGGQARRLAYELIIAADPAKRDKLLPTLLTDPGPELRFEAVQVAFDETKKKSKDDAAAKAEMTKLLNASRNFEQAEGIAKALEERGEKIDTTAHFGFVTRWLILASFDNTGGKGFQAVYPPEKKLDVAEKLKGKGEADLNWKEHVAKEQYGAVDLNKVIGKEKNAVAFGYTVVEAPREMAAELRAGCINAVKIYLNGKEVYVREVYHQGMVPDSHAVPVTLKAGRNEILMKVCQNDQKETWAQDWQFQLRITDAAGDPLRLTVVPVTVPAAGQEKP